MSLKTLNSLEHGDTAIIKEFQGNTKLQSRLVEMGFIFGTKIRMIKKTPFKGPLEVKIRSYHLSLRWQDATQILVS